MAEVIAAELIKVVFQKLGDEVLKQYVRSKGIRSELQTLQITLSDIQKLLNDASDKENGDPNVKQWLDNLQHLAYDIDDILDGLATDAMRRELNTSKVTKFIPTCCTSFSLSSKLSDKLDRIANKLQALEKKKEALGLIQKHERPKNNSRINETSLQEAYVVGREDEKNKLLNKLLFGADDPFDQKHSVVPIVGMGGVGKTTLARLLYNETQVKYHFEVRAWVCVSDDFDLLKISKTIFQEVSGENREFENLNQVQMAIIEQLKKGRFLLVLDDVWSESYDDWENLVRPFRSCAPGSKIILTTRKSQLLQQLGFSHLDQLASLSQDDALSLFAYHAMGVHNFDLHPTLKPQGKAIVNKCGCLPLALKAIGRLLRTKSSEHWDNVLNSDIWGLENDKIVPALRLSYHDLPACLKQLFAYCSLFPKDFMFDRDDLVMLWMAEGFLSQSTATLPTEHLGHEFFEMLLSRSFFQQSPNDESLYVMHDLMNELAIFVAGDYFLRFDNHMEIEKEALTKYRHMSFIREKYIAYQKFESFKKANSLRTFLVVSVGVLKSWDCVYLSNKILVDLLPELPLLRVLCLSYFHISEVPEFIGSLKHLRYLNLSQTKIMELPENVCNLYNLQTLILFGCHKLSKLPTSFLKLKKLRHFDIRDTPLLKKTPLGIGELKNLQTLTKIMIGGDDGFTTIKKLKNLHGKTSIEGFDKVNDVAYARDINFSLNRLTELELIGSDVFDGPRNEATEKEVLSELKPHSDKLKKLSIISYGGTDLPKWVVDPSFLRLIHVSINGCRKCASLPSFAQLPSLKELYIADMDEVKCVGSELLGTTSVAFPSLEVLHFKNMKRWEEWITNSGFVFPFLRELCLTNCPKLVSVSLEALPSLEILRLEYMRGWKVWSTNSGVVFPRLQELCISGCPNLVEVSFESLPSLRVLEISKSGDCVLRSIIRAASSVTKFKIEYILGLTDEVWQDVMMYLGAVEDLTIKDCNEIRYLWPSEAEASKVLVSLRKLEVKNCSNLVSLGEKQENLLVTSLSVWNCESMTHLICGNNIESLSIWGCRSMTFVSFPTTAEIRGGEQNLKSLVIIYCEKLFPMKELEGEQNINATRMSLLESVLVINWENLKSVNELSYFIHLTRLEIRDCKSLESIPDREFPNLTSLKDIIIRNCPSMDACFPRGNWPPKLCTVAIGQLKKSISEWGNQNFPTSLVELRLDGRGDEECNNISQLSDLIPTSLTCLKIVGFEKLESVSTGLQHLNSLQHLQIRLCPEINDLPETLFPSLLSLSVWSCPKLKERIHGRGWPFISHIPKIDIHD